MDRVPETIGVPFDYVLVIDALFGTQEVLQQSEFVGYRDMMRYKTDSQRRKTDKKNIVTEPITCEPLDF